MAVSGICHLLDWPFVARHPLNMGQVTYVVEATTGVFSPHVKSRKIGNLLLSDNEANEEKQNIQEGSMAE